MDLKKIELLINKYYDGKTSLQEEQELINFFSYNDVPEYLQAEAALFKEVSSLKTETMPKKELVLNAKKKSKIKVYRLYASISVAATIALAIGVTMFNNNNTVASDTTKDNIVMVKNSVESTDEEAAYQETKKALMLVSTKLSIGMKEMGRLSEFDKSQQKVKKEINNKKDTK